MKKHLAILFIFCLAGGVTGAPFKRVAGELFPNVTVNNLQEEGEINLAKELLKKETKAAVVVFTSYTCPVAIAYEERANVLVNQFGDDVFFLFLNANATETAEDWKNYIEENELKGNFAVDEESKLAKEIGAGVTPEVYLITSDGKIAYHGPIDDSQDPNHIENHLLREALMAVTSNGEIPEEKREQQAFGCTIKFPK